LAWNLEFRKKALDALENLDRKTAQRILKFLETRVITRDNPRELGKMLQGIEFENLVRFRVGDYRVVAEIKDEVLIVLIVSIGHRREVYR
jgi:mRNA interferase RelE/StbE